MVNYAWDMGHHKKRVLAPPPEHSWTVNGAIGTEAKRK